MAKAPARVTLPGSLYQKNGRWWWKANLPGEDKPKARALKPAGSRCATTDYRESQGGIGGKGQRKLRIEAEQRADSEAQARAEAESKLNEALESMQRTGICECCGRKDVPENDLAKIDSGQQLCPDCIKMLRG